MKTFHTGEAIFSLPKVQNCKISTENTKYESKKKSR